jgi:hypothetical protein
MAGAAPSTTVAATRADTIFFMDVLLLQYVGKVSLASSALAVKFTVNGQNALERGLTRASSEVMLH